jgi:Zn-dependent protease/ATP-dependent Clp protease adapter protein ClpS
MFTIQNGSFRLFRIAGIDVYLHWLWFVIAAYQVANPFTKYESQLWNLAEYVALFGIVLLHEFGHALACRQVGGRANRIMLWPLGGIAYVSPPPRPGAVLWSIAAGPLVNVALIPVTFLPFFTVFSLQWTPPPADPQLFLQSLAVMNVFLLIFNMLPVYPLDGGQIVQALLWFVIGQARSLMVVSILGLLGGGGLVLLALLWISFGQGESKLGGMLFLIIAFFASFQSLVGFLRARAMLQVMEGPRHEEVACPECGRSPPAGNFWICDQCRWRFDTFDYWAECPHCGLQFPKTICFFCRQMHPIDEWMPAVMPVDADEEIGTARVVLINDNDHSFDYIVRMLKELFGFPAAFGARLARKVDADGRVIVATTTWERAEAMRDRILSYGPDPRNQHCECSMVAVVETARGRNPQAGL